MSSVLSSYVTPARNGYSCYFYYSHKHFALNNTTFSALKSFSTHQHVPHRQYPSSRSVFIVTIIWIVIIASLIWVIIQRGWHCPLCCAFNIFLFITSFYIITKKEKKPLPLWECIDDTLEHCIKLSNTRDAKLQFT